jgi:hypothetical protein
VYVIMKIYSDPLGAAAAIAVKIKKAHHEMHGA